MNIFLTVECGNRDIHQGPIDVEDKKETQALLTLVREAQKEDPESVIQAYVSDATPAEEYALKAFSKLYDFYLEFHIGEETRNLRANDLLAKAYALPDVWMDKDGLLTLWATPEEVTPEGVLSISKMTGGCIGSVDGAVSAVRQAVTLWQNADSSLRALLEQEMHYRGITPTESCPATEDADAEVCVDGFQVQIQTSCLDNWFDLGSFSIVEVTNGRWIFHHESYTTVESAVSALDALIKKAKNND